MSGFLFDNLPNPFSESGNTNADHFSPGVCTSTGSRYSNNCHIDSRLTLLAGTAFLGLDAWVAIAAGSVEVTMDVMESVI